MSANIVLNYTEAVYQKKINELERLVSKLNYHIETLESLKSKIPMCWEDENAYKYIKVLNDEIRAVKNASYRTKALKDFYEESKDEINAKQTIFGGDVDTVMSMVNSLNISND